MINLLANTTQTTETDWNLFIGIFFGSLAFLSSCVVAVWMLAKFLQKIKDDSYKMNMEISKELGNHKEHCQESLENACNRIENRMTEESEMRRKINDKVIKLEAKTEMQDEQIKKMDEKLDTMQHDMHEIKNSITAIASVINKDIK